MKVQLVRNVFLSFLCALQIGVFGGGIAKAEEQNAASGVAITEFALLEKKFDKTGIAEFKPDGTRDGHFQVRINFPEKTVVNAIILRSTDVFGKENYQGIWRTNRVGVGWLLGIVQGGKVITPAFRPKPTDPVGTFEGSVTFDLYANDNRTIKEGQYYVLEIETPDDTIYSKPITFGEPMSGGSTGESAPNPTPIPTPTPQPNSGQVTDLTVTGGQGTLVVQGATPGAMITLFHSKPQGSVARMYNFGTKIADSKGSTTFAKLPSGNMYYVTETVNWQKIRTSGEATVTEEKTADLINAQSIETYISSAGSDPSKQIHLHLEGTVPNSEIKTVGVSFAGVFVNVPVDEKGRFFLKKTYAIFSPMDVVTVTATASTGKKQVMHITPGFDLFNDATVKVEKIGTNKWMLRADKGVVKNAGFNVYLIEGNKLIPVVPDPSAVFFDQFGSVTRFKGLFATEKPIQDIRLFVEAVALVEIVPVLP